MTPGDWPRRLVASASRHPCAVLVLTAVATIVCALGLARLRVILTIDDMEPSPAFPSLAVAARVRERFEPGSSLVAVVSNPRTGEPFRASDVCRLKAFFDARMLADKHLVSVHGPWSAARFVPSSSPDAPPLPFPIVGDPCTIAPKAPYPLESLRGSAFEGLLASNDARRFVVSLQLVDGTGTSPVGKDDPRLVGGLQRDVLDATRGFPLEIAFTGTGTFRWHLFEAFTRDALFNVLAILGCAALFRFLYGSWRGALLVAGNLALLGVWIFGGMGLSGVELDLLSNSILVVLGISALQDFLFVSHARLRAPHAPWRKAFEDLALPSLLTTFTTMVGFGSLLVSPYTPLRVFGFWSALGAGLEWYVTFVVMPAFLSVAPRLTAWTSTARARSLAVLERLGHWTPRRAVTALLLLAFAASPSIAARIELMDRPHGYLGASHSFNRGIAALLEGFGWDSRLMVHFDARDPDLERDVVSALRATGLVARVESAASVEADMLRDVPPRWTELATRELRASRDFARYVDAASGEQVVRVYVNDTGLASLRRLREATDTACAGRCRLTDTLVSFLEVSDTLLSTLFKSFSLSLALVLLTLVAIARATRTRQAWKLLLTAAFGPTVILAICGLFHVPINFVTGVFAAVLVGVTGDNAIQYMLGGVDERSGGSVQVLVVSVFLSASFLLSSLAAAKLLGLLFAAGFLVNLVGDLWLLRGLGWPPAPRPDSSHAPTP